MLPIAIKNSENNNYFQINWMLHDKCTYACSYCPPSNHKGTDSWLKLDKVIDTCNSIQNQIGDKLNMQILFSGGEPTVWKDFPELARHLYKKNWSLNIVSNLSRSLEWWKTLDIQWNQASASLHPEFTDIENFIEKCNFIKTTAQILTARIMLHPNPVLFKKAIDFGHRIKTSCPEVYIEWVPIIYEFGGVQIPLSQYSDDQIKIISILKPGAAIKTPEIQKSLKTIVWENKSEMPFNAQHLIKANKNRFEGWECDAGLDGIFIDSRGNIFRGTCLQGNKIGNIQDDSIVLPSNSVICNKRICECVTDVYYSKKNIEFYKKVDLKLDSANPHS
jgi:organic radical activating enzyme